MDKQIIRKLTLQSAVLLLAFTSSMFGKDPAIVELGRIQSGQVVPQIAAGLGEWSTAFQIFNLDPSGDSHEITLNFFQGVGNPLALELFDESGASLGTMSSYDATLNAGGSTAIRTSTAGNLRVGYAVLEVKGDDDVGVPGFQLVGMTAILTRAGADNFRTAVPAPAHAAGPASAAVQLYRRLRHVRSMGQHFLGSADGFSHSPKFGGAKFIWRGCREDFGSGRARSLLSGRPHIRSLGERRRRRNHERRGRNRSHRLGG